MSRPDVTTDLVRCPTCGNKTRLQLWVETELKHFPLYYPKCKQESLIDAKDSQVRVIKGLQSKKSLLRGRSSLPMSMNTQMQ